MNADERGLGKMNAGFAGDPLTLTLSRQGRGDRRREALGVLSERLMILEIFRGECRRRGKGSCRQGVGGIHHRGAEG